MFGIEGINLTSIHLINSQKLFHNRIMQFWPEGFNGVVIPIRMDSIGQ